MLLLIASGISGLAIAISYTGVFQALELSVYDLWFRWRSPEKKDPRIVVVTIGESDISQLGQWSISDRTLSELITKIDRQQPRAIGLDLYRDLPVPPGTENLAAVYRSIPNIVGVEKVIDAKVRPSPILEQLGQTAFADLVIDPDGKIRRGLLSVRLEDGRVQLSFAARLALMYLAAEGVELKPVGNRAKRSLGQAEIVPFKPYDGGYIDADAGGFQVLLNFRGVDNSFPHVSIVEVLEGNIPEDLMRDRIVLIGSTAQSLNDLFFTPYSRSQGKGSQYLPGVFVHANLTSQILSAALDGRALIRVVSEPGEWLWIFAWTCSGSFLSFVVLNYNPFSKPNFSSVRSAAVSLFLPGIVLFGSCYLLFLYGWWLPAIAPLFSLTFSTVAVSGYYNQNEKKLAFIDDLTQIPNRRYFERFLEQQWLANQNKQQSLSLILCDVDYFKKYNDTYGHQAGDLCLQRVAQAISQAVRSYDLAARYGGEEFVVVLPNTTPETATIVARRICYRLKSLQIPHSGSQVSKYVSLSCGVASTGIADINLQTSYQDLIASADRALYQAKKQGRDRAVLAEFGR